MMLHHIVLFTPKVNVIYMYMDVYTPTFQSNVPVTFEGKSDLAS